MYSLSCNIINIILDKTLGDKHTLNSQSFLENLIQILALLNNMYITALDITRASMKETALQW